MTKPSGAGCFIRCRMAPTLADSLTQLSTDVDSKAMDVVALTHCQHGNTCATSDQLAVEVHFFPLSSEEVAERSGNLRTLFLIGARRFAQQNEIAVKGPRLPKRPRHFVLDLVGEMKTNKHQTLLLAKKQRGVHSRDIVKHFGYSPGTARSYLSYLGRQSLLERPEQTTGLQREGKIACTILMSRDAQTLRARSVRGKPAT